MAKIGYARVSSGDQDLTIQIERLQEAGCSPIRSEKVSAQSRDDRYELASIIEFIRSGDELVVLRLDRLARNTRDVLNVVHELSERGASLRILEPEITTSGSIGSVMITVLGMVAEMERSFLKERQRQGIAKAKSKGVYKGRKRTIDVERIYSLHKDGVGNSDIARQVGCSRMSVHRAIKDLEYITK